MPAIAQIMFMASLAVENILKVSANDVSSSVSILNIFQLKQIGKKEKLYVSQTNQNTEWSDKYLFDYDKQ